VWSKRYASAVEDRQVEPLLQSVREHCYTRTRYVSPLPPVAESGEFYPPSPVEVQVGGATVFVLRAADVARVLRSGPAGPVGPVGPVGGAP
jgi:uncharacterized protein YaaQ